MLVWLGIELQVTKMIIDSFLKALDPEASIRTGGRFRACQARTRVTFKKT